MNINYFDGQHMATNTVNPQQMAHVAEMTKDNIPELVYNDTGEVSDNYTEQYIQYNEGLEMIPEESDDDLLITAQGDGDQGDTIPYIQGDSEDEQFNTAIDDTSDDPMIVMGKPLTTTFISANVHVPTEQVVRRRGRLAPRQPLSVCALLPAYEENRHLRPLGNLGHRLRRPRWID